MTSDRIADCAFALVGRALREAATRFAAGGTVEDAVEDLRQELDILERVLRRQRP